jgi:hypothetical protein
MIQSKRSIGIWNWWYVWYMYNVQIMFDNIQILQNLSKSVSTVSDQHSNERRPISTDGIDLIPICELSFP